MKPLGEIVAQLRSLNGWTMQELASRVTHAGPKSVKYQHIQYIETHVNTAPRYLSQLATAFGKTVEELQHWTEDDPVFGHQKAGHSLRVGDEAGLYNVRGSFNKDEIELIMRYRSCIPKVQQAIQVIAAAGQQHSITDVDA